MKSRTHFSWNCMNKWTKSRFEVAVTSYGRNKNREIKKHSRTSPDVQFKEFSLTKQKTRPRTDYEWIGKANEKSDPINRKTVKIKVKLPHVKKPLARKRIFVQTPFSHSTLKLERKISRRKTTRFFAPLPVSAWPKLLLQFDFKNHENVWTDLKKKTAPQYNSNSLNCKKTKRRPIIAPAIAVRLLIKRNMRN